MQQADGQVLIRAEMDTSAVTDGIAEMRAAMDALKTYASRRFSEIRVQVQGQGNALASDMPGLATRLIGALAAGLSGGGARVGSALRTALASALNSGSDYTSRFSSIGSYVISGIISGIQGNAASLWSTLRSVASNMLATLKHALGIQSPSRVMREEIGRQIGAGIAQGMLDSRDLVAAASETLSSDAVVHGGVRMSQLGAAGVLLRAGTIGASVGGGSRAVQKTYSASEKPAQVVGGNTFIFQKPVETPYRHAQAIRETMEEMLYGT